MKQERSWLSSSKQKITDELIVQIEGDKAAEATRAIVAVDEAAANEASHCREIADESRVRSMKLPWWSRQSVPCKLGEAAAGSQVRHPLRCEVRDEVVCTLLSGAYKRSPSVTLRQASSLFHTGTTPSPLPVSSEHLLQATCDCGHCMDREQIEEVKER